MPGLFDHWLPMTDDHVASLARLAEALNQSHPQQVRWALSGSGALGRPAMAMHHQGPDVDTPCSRTAACMHACMLTLQISAKACSSRVSFRTAPRMQRATPYTIQQCGVRQCAPP